jgi:2'-5' RNA ligase/Zn finger protein HypA/HybF involved in hydrogenase expression
MLTLEAKAAAWDKSDIEMTPSERAYTLNPTEQRVKAIQNERIDQWRLKKLSPEPTQTKMATETRTQQLRRAEGLEQEHGQPDMSVPVHDFGNGWTIREPQTLGDLRREGELMGNCFRPECHEGIAETINPEYQPYAKFVTMGGQPMKFGERTERASGQPVLVGNLHEIPWNAPIREKGRYFSLRDPDNLPHVSIDHTDDYNGVLGKHNVEPKPEHREMVDDWETKEFGEPLGGFRESSFKKDEMHIGAGVPSQAGVEINQWVHDQKWPEGTELEDVDEYHITMLFLQGEGAGEHRDDDWTHERHAVTVKGIKEFPPSKEKSKEGLHPIVLLVEGESLQDHHEALVDKAEDRGLEVGEYTRDKYSPHITIAYGPSLPDGISPPTITFETEESSVSDAREDRTLDDIFGDADGSYGDMWVNKTEKKVYWSFGDWEPELSDEAKPLIEKEYPGFKYDGESEQGDPGEHTEYNRDTKEMDRTKVPGWKTIYQRGEKVSKVARSEWVCPECNHSEFDGGENSDAMLCPNCESEMYPYPREDFYDTLRSEDLPEGGLWHMAPTEERARIQQHGLQPAHPKDNPQWQNVFGIEFQPEGVYGTPYEEGTSYWGFPTEKDKWFVPADQIKEMNRDPLTRAMSVPHAVQPQLHTPAEEHWDWKNKTIPQPHDYYESMVKVASEYPIVDWPRLAADILDKGLAPKGMPRPLGEHPTLGLRPVPWTQKNLNEPEQGSGWGMVHADRSKKARENSLCLLCGEPVDQGKVFVDVKARKEFADEYGHDDLLPWARADQSSPIVDRGAMHDRCAELTAAHCPHIKDAINNGGVLQAPYRKDAPGSPLSQSLKQRWEQQMAPATGFPDPNYITPEEWMRMKSESSDSWRPKTLWPPGESEGEGTTPDHGDVSAPYTPRNPLERTDDECHCGEGTHCEVHNPFVPKGNEGDGSRSWRTASEQPMSECPDCEQDWREIELDRDRLCPMCGGQVVPLEPTAPKIHTPQSDWHTDAGWSGIPQAFGRVGADEYDSREYQDSHMLAPNLPNEKSFAMDADGNYRGCTCEWDKLKCPIHGMNPEKEDPGMEWSIAQGSPVGWHEENYTKHNDT